MAKQLSQEMLETLLEERDAGYSLKGLNLKGLDLRGLKITSVEGSCFDNTTNFSRTDLTGTKMSKMTEITDVDLVDTHLAAVKPGDDDLETAKTNATNNLEESDYYDKSDWEDKIDAAKSVEEVNAMVAAIAAEENAYRPTQAALVAASSSMVVPDTGPLVVTLMEDLESSHYERMTFLKFGVRDGKIAMFYNQAHASYSLVAGDIPVLATDQGENKILWDGGLGYSLPWIADELVEWTHIPEP